MAEKVEIVIEAQDNASSELGAINEELRSIGSIQRTEALRDLGAAGFDAFMGIADAAKEFVDIAAESELVATRMEAQLNALGSATDVTANQINGLADELSNLTGFDDEDLVNAQTTLLRFGVTSEESFDRATRAATDLAAATGQDLNSAFQAVGVALDTGNWGRLTRSIGDMTAEQKAALKAAQDAGDAMAAQGIILDALEQKVNGAGEAIGSTWTGKMNIAKIQVDNFKQSIGDGLLGVLNQLPQSAITAGVGITQFAGTIGTIAGPLADVLISVKALGGLGGVFTALSGAASGAGTAITAAVGAISLPIIALVAAVGALILVWNEWGDDAMNTLNMIGQIIGALGNRISFEVGAAIDGARAKFAVFGSEMPMFFEDGSGKFQEFLMLFGVGEEKAQQFGQVIYDLLAEDVVFLFEDGSGAFQRFLEFFGVGEERAQQFGIVVYDAVTKIRDSFGNLLLAMANVGEQFATVGMNIVQGIWDGIQAGWGWLFDNISSSLDDLLAWVKDKLGIASGSKVWAAEIGKNIAVGVGDGETNEMKSSVAGRIGDSLMPSAAGMSGGGRGRGDIIINLPATMVADRQYAATQLVPILREANRKL